MRAIILTLVSVLLMLSTQPVAVAQATSLVGTYDCRGNDGTEDYLATVTITLRKETYYVTWDKEGQTGYWGIGRMEGGQLIVAYGNPKSLGLAMYRRDGARLIGRWVDLGDEKGEVPPETLTPAGTRAAK